MHNWHAGRPRTRQIFTAAVVTVVIALTLSAGIPPPSLGHQNTQAASTVEAVATRAPTLGVVASTDFSGGYAVARNTTGRAGLVTMNDNPNTVSRTEAGGTYIARVRLRSEVEGQEILLRMQEWRQDRVAEAFQPISATAEWTEATVGLVATNTGDTIDLNVVAIDLPPGASFEVDYISLTGPDDLEFVKDPTFTQGIQNWRIPVRGTLTHAQHAPTTSPTPPPTPDASQSSGSEPTVPPGWSLFWSDEFEDQGVDTSRWKTLNSNYGAGGGQLQCHTPANVDVGSGTLKIVAREERVLCPGGLVRDYSSGFLSSRDAKSYYPLYGRYEIRARVPHGQGVGAAFWLRHATGGASTAEVDVLEVFHSQLPGKATQTLHFPRSLGSNVSKKATFIETPIDGTGSWHTYAVEIEPVRPGDDTAVRFRFFIDDELTHTYTNTRAGAWTNVDKARGWDIAISVPVGGSYWGHPKIDLGYLSSQTIGGPNPHKCSLTYRTPLAGPSSCPIGRDADGEPSIWFADFPATYEVDWVRVMVR